MARSLRVLIRPVEIGEAKLFVAQCLEFNIAVQGQTGNGALMAFVEHLVQTLALVHKHGAENPFTYLGQAPPETWRAWDEAFKGIPQLIPVDNGLCIEPALAYAC